MPWKILDIQFCKERKRILLVFCVCIALLVYENKLLMPYKANNSVSHDKSLRESLLSSGGSNLSYPTIILKFNDDEIIPSALNRTKGNILIYNRVPKCASSLFKHLLSRSKTSFKNFASKIHNERQLTKEKEAELLDWVIAKHHEYKLPLAYNRHFFFIDPDHHKIHKGDSPN